MIPISWPRVVAVGVPLFQAVTSQVLAQAVQLYIYVSRRLPPRSRSMYLYEACEFWEGFVVSKEFVAAGRRPFTGGDRPKSWV